MNAYHWPTIRAQAVISLLEPIVYVGQEEGPWHFCSHLALWALAMSDRVEARP